MTPTQVYATIMMLGLVISAVMLYYMYGMISHARINSIREAR